MLLFNSYSSLTRKQSHYEHIFCLFFLFPPAFRTIYQHWINVSRKHRKPKQQVNIVEDA